MNHFYFACIFKVTLSECMPHPSFNSNFQIFWHVFIPLYTRLLYTCDHSDGDKSKSVCKKKSSPQTVFFVKSLYFASTFRCQHSDACPILPSVQIFWTKTVVRIFAQHKQKDLFIFENNKITCKGVVLFSTTCFFILVLCSSKKKTNEK